MLKMILLCLFSLSSFAYEKADAFIVKIFDDKVRVLSPTEYDPGLAVIVENKTLVNITGKVETESGEVLSYLHISPGKSKTVNVKKIKNERVFFIPQSPPFQKVDLKLGSKPYEIPPRQ